MVKELETCSLANPTHLSEFCRSHIECSHGRCLYSVLVFRHWRTQKRPGISRESSWLLNFLCVFLSTGHFYLFSFHFSPQYDEHNGIVSQARCQTYRCSVRPILNKCTLCFLFRRTQHIGALQSNRICRFFIFMGIYVRQDNHMCSNVPI